VSCRDKHLVILREEIEEDAVDTSITNDESINGREVKTFAWSVCRHLVYLSINGLQQFINSHHQRSRYLTVITRHGYQLIRNTSSKDHSTVPISLPEDCLYTYSTTANGMAGGASGLLVPYRAPHRDSGSYELHMPRSFDFLSFADKSHVLGTVHFTNNGHLSLSNRLSANVTKTRKRNYSFISYNVCISTDSEMDRRKSPTELNGNLCCSRM